MDKRKVIVCGSLPPATISIADYFNAGRERLVTDSKKIKKKVWSNDDVRKNLLKGLNK